MNEMVFQKELDVRRGIAIINRYMKDEVPSTKEGVEEWLREMKKTNRKNVIKFWLVTGAVVILALYCIKWLIPA